MPRRPYTLLEYAKRLAGVDVREIVAREIVAPASRCSVRETAEQRRERKEYIRNGCEGNRLMALLMEK